jgi:SAM-dependent methyltransferase
VKVDILEESHGKTCKDGLMDFDHFTDQNGIKKWLRNLFFIRPIVQQFKGYVLDIGCGPGIYLEQYSGPSLGIDAHPNNIRICQKKGIHIIEADANSFVQENSFDTVLVSHVLEHLDNPGRVFENAFRNAKPGGRIIIIVPCREGFEAGLNTDVGHKTFITEAYLDNCIRKFNGKKIQSTQFPPFFGGKYKELRIIFEKLT